MTTTEMSPIAMKVKDGVDIIQNRIMKDIYFFSIPVKKEPDAWNKWMKEWFLDNGFDSLSAECRPNIIYARKIAFEVLYKLGGYTCPLLCITEFLQGEKELTYWRAIAIAASTKDCCGT